MRGRRRVLGVGRDGRRSGRAAGLLRGRLALLAVVVVVAGGAVVSSTVWGAGAASRGPVSSPAAEQELRGLVQAEVGRIEAKRAALRQPLERARRQASRSEFRGLSDGVVERMAAKAWPSVVSAKPAGGLLLGAGDRMEGFMGTDAVRIRRANGKRVVAVSTAPLAVKGADGQSEALDLSLKDHGAMFAPARGAGLLEIAKHVSGGVMLGGQVGFISLGRRNSPASRMGDSVMWPNMATDADTMVRPLPEGAEVFTQLRSASSPEHLAFRFMMPAGASVRPSPMGQHGVEVVDATGRVLSSVGAISAQDADGSPVPVSYRLAGDVLRVHVSHRHGDFHYPILVDPVVTDPNYTGPPSAVAAGFWQYNTVGSGGPCFGPFAGNAYLGAGQYIRWLGPNTCRIYAYDHGYFYYPAPGDASVTAVTYGNIRQDNYPNTPMCTYTEFLENGSTGYAVEPNTSKVPSCFEMPVSVSYSTYGGYYPHNFGVWGQYSACAIGAAPSNYCDYSYFLAYASGLTAYVEDDKAPVISTGQGPPVGWTNNDGAPISANAIDSGIGTEYATLSVQSGSTNTVLDRENANARGLCPYGVRCSPNLPTNATVGQLPEGVSTIIDQAQDVAGNNSGPQQVGTAMVDRSPPSVALSGPLYDNHDNVPPQNANLHISATDGSNDGNPTDERSGVASIAVQVDGTQVASQNQTCDNSCPLALDYSFDQTKYSAGAHTISVMATDLAGNVSAQQSFTVYTDQDPPDVTESGTLWDANGADISDPSYTLSIDATDGSTDLPDSGVASIAVNVDGQQQLSASQPCTQGSCAMSQTFTFQTAQYGAGEHTIDIYVTDQVGHQTHDQETVSVVQTPAQPPQSGNVGSSSERTFQGASSNDQAGSSVVDIGDINGDGIDDYAIGAPGATSQTVRSQSGKIYVVYGSASGGVTNLGSLGSGGFEIDGATGDRAGTVLSTGDVAGDGTDLIIGAPGSAADGYQGKVYVVFNSALSSGNVDLSNLGSNGFVVNGPAASA